MTDKLISICVPVLNEERNVRELCARVNSVFESLTGYTYEIIFTDNASDDNTYSILAELAAKEPRIRVASFSRNQGYQKSILTGYLLARGECAVQLDCDLQDPPELIPAFIDEWRNGADVVYGVRKQRQGSKVMTFLRRLFYRVLNLISEDPIPPDAGDFRLISRRIIEILRQVDEQNPYLRGTIARIGFKQTGIEYERKERSAGKTKFNAKELFKLAIDAVVTNSEAPLRVAAYLALLSSCAALILVGRYLWEWFYVGANWPSGFATLALLVLANIAITSTLFAILGVYVIRLSKQTKPMPIAIISRGIRVGKVENVDMVKIIDSSE